jgi:hypothetical protein
LVSYAVDCLKPAGYAKIYSGPDSQNWIDSHSKTKKDMFTALWHTCTSQIIRNIEIAARIPNRETAPPGHLNEIESANTVH